MVKVLAVWEKEAIVLYSTEKVQMEKLESGEKVLVGSMITGQGSMI